jgi:hypothetical protein
MKGCRISCRMFFSFLTCSTCFSLITSLMARIFIAPYFLVDFSRQRHTRPKVPVPETKKHRNFGLHTTNIKLVYCIEGKVSLCSFKSMEHRIFNFRTAYRKALNPLFPAATVPSSKTPVHFYRWHHIKQGSAGILMTIILCLLFYN